LSSGGQVKFEKSDFILFSFLVAYSEGVIFFIVLIVSFGTAVILFFKLNEFHFGWDDFYKAFRAGWSVGIPGGGYMVYFKVKEAGEEGDRPRLVSGKS